MKTRVKQKLLSYKRGKEFLTSGFRFETRTVHLSFVPLIPGGKPPPKAAAIAAALAIYIAKETNSSSCACLESD